MVATFRKVDAEEVLEGIAGMTS